MPRETPKELSFACEARFVAAAAADKDGPPKPPRFSMVAYTGGPMVVGSWMDPVILDLSGIDIPTQKLPIRRDHLRSQLVGHTESVEVKDGEVLAAGVISFDNDAARDVIVAARNGFPWQASVGASADVVEFLAAGKTATVNGNQVVGPLDIVRKSTLKEISFVDLGADSATSATVAARRAKEEEKMDEEKKQGGDAASQAKGTGAADPAVRAAADGGRGGQTVQAASSTEAILNAARQEQERAQNVRDLIAAAIERNKRLIDDPDMKSLAAKADTEKLSPQAVELALAKLSEKLALQAQRPGAPAVNVRSEPLNDAVLACAVLMSCGMSGDKLAKDRDFGENVVQAAWSRTRGRMGLHELIAASLQANGLRVEHGGEGIFRSLLQASYLLTQQALGIQAGFSTVSLPGILGTVGNKLLLDSFTQVATTYQELAQLSDFNNFLTYTQYRLTATGGYEKLGPSGELKHAKLGEESYTNRLETRGKMVTLKREDIVNDDLGALQQMFRLLGRDAGLELERATYDAFMESSDTVFTSGRANRLTSSALSLTTLQAADAALMMQQNENGDPIYAMGSRLVVPPALKALADAIYVSEKIVGSSEKPEANTMRGRAKPITSPFLQLSTGSRALAGASASTWYLFADPAMLPFLQVAFLQGKRQPTVETADAAFNTLGISMRSFFDFGVAVVDYRGANKSTA